MIDKFVLRRDLIDWQDLLIKHIFLISDRLLEGRKIPAGEKLYSLFEQHTEWVAKGKSRPNVELGRRLLIATDQYHRYTGLGVLSYNLHRIGNHLQGKQREAEKNRRPAA